MALDVPKESPAGLGLATAGRNGLEDPAESARMTLLVKAAQSGDRAAVDGVVAVVTPVVLSVVRSLLGPRQPDIEQAVHEVMLVVVEALPSWRADPSLLRFAVRIAAHRAMAAPRRGRSPVAWMRRLAQRQRIRFGISPLRAEASAPDRRREFLRMILGELPETQAEVMLFRLVLGFSIEEIAGICNAPPSVVRRRLRFAKEALRDRIEANPDWPDLWDTPA